MIATVAALALAGPARAEFPGQNGKIVFTNGDLWLINSDGSDEHEIATQPPWLPASKPDWSPNGSKIAFGDDVNITVINADGSGRTNITDSSQPPESAGYYYSSPSWSPDGTRIAFDRAYHDGQAWDDHMEIWVADPDGSNLERLPTTTPSAARPKWHPDGTRIAFNGCQYPCHAGDQAWVINPDGTGQAPFPAPAVDDWSPDGSKVLFTAPGVGTVGNGDTFVQNADGTGRVNLTNTTYGEGPAHWSPDGGQIVYSGARPRIMNADGSNSRRLTQSSGGQPDWQPVPINAYPRPKSAHPMQVSLVPAYQACDSPNRQHGPPLAFGSCAPPVQSSAALTVGTADSNDRPTQSVGEVFMSTLLGNPATPADEADIRLRASIADVLLTSDLSDYAGSLEARMTVRITDKDNTPHPGGPGAGTTQAVTYSFAIPCAASQCSVDTTAEALVPGIAKERSRAIWELSQLEVLDGVGNVFMRQGIFVP